MHGSMKRTHVVNDINELVEIYNSNFDTFKLILPAEFIREIEECLSRLILKYVFLGAEPDSDDAMMISISKKLLRILLWISDYC